jgi:hypothetical protein
VKDVSPRRRSGAGNWQTLGDGAQFHPRSTIRGADSVLPFDSIAARRRLPSTGSCAGMSTGLAGAGVGFRRVTPGNNFVIVF